MLIIILGIGVSYSLFQFNRYRDNLFIYREFTNELIVGYGTFFRTEPDSISDFIEFAQAPNFDWNQYTPPYRTFDSTIVLKLLKKSTLKIEDSVLNIYLNENNNCCIEPENYTIFNYLFQDKKLIINKFPLHHKNVGNRGMYNLELFSNYNRVYDTIIEFHFSRKLRKFHRDHFSTYILPTFNLDSTTLFYHIKKKEDGFTYKVAFSPNYISTAKADSIFQILKDEYLNDSLSVYFDRINIPVIITGKKRE